MSDLIDRQAAIDALKAIRYGLWEIDIPFPTVPEYVEHHEQIKNMMEITDGWIKKLKEQPSAQQWMPVTEWKNDFKGYVNALDLPRDDYKGIMAYIEEVPSAKPEPYREEKGDATD